MNLPNKWRTRKGAFLTLLLILQYAQTSAKRIDEITHFESFVCRTENAVCDITDKSTEVVAEEEERKIVKRAVILTTLFVISIIASVANLGFDIYLEIKGCAGLYPSIDTYYNDIEATRKTLKDLGNKANDKYTDSLNLLEYLKTTNRQARDIWFHVFRIMELTTMVFEELDPNLLNSFMDKTLYLKGELQKRNQTLESVDFKQLTTKYQGVFSSVNNALIGLSPLVGQLGFVAISKGLSWYKVSKISNGKLAMGSKSVGKAVSSTSSTASKAVQTTSKLSKVMKGAGAMMSVVAIGMEIYSAVMKVQACKDKRDKIKAARDKLKPEIPEFEKTLGEVRTHYTALDREYKKVKNQITTDQLFQYLSNITQIANSGHSLLQKASSDVTVFESKIKKAGYAETVDLQEKLVGALSKYTFTWSCLETQVKIISYVSNKCAVGQAEIRTIYDQAVANFIRIADCTLAVGEKYTTFDKTQTYVNLQMKSKNLESDCLLNNANLFELTCLLNAKGWETDYIIGKTGLTKKQIGHIVAKCPAASLTPKDKKFICLFKQVGNSLADVKELYAAYDNSEVGAVYNACT